ncbi:MAG: carboxypeptidase regulatory-like domain-containing protein, partial [Sphingobacteriaceae bacterium]|nr:carboxypeptidase regulatory-like domain-containing protein [Cytophagaceae bacterium]
MRHVFLAIFLLLGLSAFAQNPNRLSIRGTVVDTSNVPQAGATVMLLLPKDSTLASYGRSNDKGFFEFKNLKKASYLLKITFVGCLPIQRDIVPGDDGTVELGALKLKPIAKELLEVVIRTAKAPLTIRGDTVEYNASSFKVPPGATVEDLLRKLPGVVVDQDGGIKAQGQDVKKVTVDGKSFFGADPKLATKNLAADAIAKVQIFNDKSEQSKITGVDDGRKEKTVNLELKESARKGGFGKITAGGGLDGGTSGARGEVKGNYNRFNTKNQFSIIGLGNNTNQTGVSFDDYQDFRGSQSFNWNDDADFSFSSGGRSISFGGDDDESLSIPISGRSGRGFSEN